MGVNLDKPQLWKADVSASVDMYNEWFMRFAPQAFRETRVRTTSSVEEALKATDNLTNVKPDLLRRNPNILPTLRMATCPPIAVDRLIGLAGVSDNLVKCMEKNNSIPPRMPLGTVNTELAKIGAIIERLADPDIFVWLKRASPATEAEIHRAATIIADRLCGAWANPIIRNAQEQRQLAEIKAWLEAKGYRQIAAGDRTKFNAMEPGTFSFRMNVPVTQEGSGKSVNIPVDAVIMPLTRPKGRLPIFIEAKSAGDFTNTNKRRKEEAVKMTQLKATYGPSVEFNLFLCGYFDSGYLGYEAAEGIDWVWEHRIDDLAGFGI
jgi:type II restriction enzyme